MRYGYARVSTNNQDLEAQIKLLEKEGCDKIFTEKLSGSRMHRPEFENVLALLKDGDTLIVTKVDRFARNTKTALETIQNLFERNIRVHILNMGIIENTPTGRLIFSIFSAFAEFERDLIVERTQEGKALAKQRDDFVEGRPKKFTKKQLDHAMQLKSSGMSYKQVSELTGISISTLTRTTRKSQNSI